MKKFYFLVLILLTFSAFAQNYGYTVYNTSNSGIASNYVGDIKIDANGLLWISSYSGVSTFNGTTFTKYNTSNSAIASNAILKIEIDGLGRKWMASQNNGIIRYSGTTWTNYTTSNSGLPNNAIKDIAVDGLNNLWVASPSGLTKFNGTTWTTYPALTDINSIATDSNNGVWVSAGNVLYKFNGTDFNIITDGVQKILRIANNTIYIDAFDALMTYTTAGTFLNIYFQNTSCLAGYQLNALDLDSNNKAWIAFQGDGLQNFTDCISYTSNSGLPDNYISTVRTQANGTIWSGTLQLGLVKMTPSASTCSAPTQTWAENITPTTATLNWIPAVPSPDSYVIRYNTTNVIGGIQTATFSSPLTLENLTPNTDYHWWVASVCGEQQSNWVYGGFFYTLQAAPTCNTPTNLGISSMTSNSCQMSWTTPSPIPSSGFEIYLATNNIAPVATTTPTLTSTSLGVQAINGLTAGATYYYWIRSNCGSGKSSWASGGSFTTHSSFGCNEAVYGLYPTTNYLPTCNGGSDQIVPDAWAGEYSNVSVATNRQYTFTSSVPTDFITLTNTSGTVVLASGSTPLIWLSESTSGVIRYYLHTNQDCGIQNTNRAKYIQCVPIINCGLPTALSVSNITSNSCRLTWNAPTPAASSYDLYVSTSNTAPIAGTTATQTSNGNIVGSLNGLASSTTYYYWVRSNCNGTKSAWVSGGSFTTIIALNCNGAIYGLYPEATFTPTCSPSSEQIATDAWAGEYTNVNVTSNHQYTFSSSIATDFITITNASGTAVLASGTSPLVWNSNTTSGIIRYHLNTNTNCGVQNSGRIKYIQCTVSQSCGLPTNLSVSNITSNSCRLFWNAPTPVANSYDIYLSTNNSTPQATTNATQTSVPNLVQYLNGLTASTTYYYWVRSNCNGTKSAWVSGGSFTTISYLNCNGATYGLYPNSTFIPTCTGSVEQITTAAYAGEYSNVSILANKQYTFSSSIATDYITITNATGTTLLASGVTPLVWNSATSGIIRYHINTNANCGVQNANRIRSIKCEDASGCNVPTQLYYDGLSSTSNNIGWVASTPAPSNGYVYCYSTVNDPFSAGAITGTTTETFAVLNNLSPNTTYYFWVKSNCGNTQTNWVSGGSFTTYPASGCNAPTQLYYDGLSSTSNNIGWATPTPAPSNGYVYCYSTVNDPFSVGAITGTTTETFAVLSNLSSNTTYYFWVKSNCGNTQSNWVSGGSFTTYPASGCNVPTQLYYDGLSATSNNIGWAAPTPAPSNGYVYCYSTVNDPFSEVAITGTTTETFAVLNNLSPNTTYYFWVKSNCGNTQTNWVSGGSFTTYPASGCNPPTQFWADEINATTATIGWVPPTNTPDSYIYTYNTTNEIIDIQDSTAFTFANLENLTPNTDYHWWVASVCGETQTAWTYGGVFTTLQGATPTYCFEKIAGGRNFTLAIKSDGTLWAWGNNSYGQLGDGTTVNKLVPTQISTSTDWESVSAGFGHSVAIKNNGTLWTWGFNLQGQLGDGTNTNKTVPTQIGTATNWEIVEARGQHNIAKKSNGTLWAWGSNSFSQLGDGTAINRYSPIQIGTATNWQSIGTGGAHSMAIKTDGTLWCWGFNSNGQVGDGTATNRYVPTQIGTATNWKSVTGGSYFTIATKTNNSLWTWGRNYNGELGLNDTTDRSVPTQVGTATNWDKIAAGEDHALASRTYGALFAWGYDSVGQVGNGSSTENVLAPTLLLNVQSWISLKAGGTHSLAIDNEGKLYTWGNNSEGQLGNGSTVIDYEVYGFLPCPNNNLSVEDLSQMNSLKIYPNPVTDALNIVAMQDIASVSVYNMLGQEVIVKAIHANEVSINMSNLASGTYLVKVNTENSTKTVKIVKL
ncbi:alpha-tubulin suppressor-like RCC1 family protein/ligand-binding sensor domain-containing protein [Flavobacterium arsenatis]|uniref:Alpha-tubulin suppressor-like RCC1 family protein/ligand-binding sensor domain-containing protein n=1 Tax=Flavobacterium arsenatis TaxID=1484332 RepID=A0ABU1TL69_9FLAO|nr:fibronectin type III domain-containing protein [Flavobacterium arsenatis]MDR6966721.1 alpha-tubulin suppressor-like RCC1 family protein/ligand-binding sensor domain-containing protein [Flavobacterium arsenatis]